MIRQGKTRNAAGGRAAFTLVELLVTISIIAILAALLLGVSAVAAETGRASKTKQMITRLHTLLMEHYETYRDRRVDLDPTIESIINGQTNVRKGELIAEARLHALRETMITEMPDHWSDILLEPVDFALVQDPNYVPPAPLYADMGRSGIRRTALGELLYRKLQQAARSAPSREALLENQSAECLYLIIMFATGDGEARGLFKESDFGDTDGDGAPEFLDGWGNPIQFLRWAPGCDSPTQLNSLALDLVRKDAVKNGVDPVLAATNTVASNRDPFDAYRQMSFLAPSLAELDSGNGALFGHYLMPYIYSHGEDEESGILDARTLIELNGSTEYLAWTRGNNIAIGTPRFGNLKFNRFPNPYMTMGSDGRTPPNVTMSTELTAGLQLGQPLDDSGASTDNLTNHYITAE